MTEEQRIAGAIIEYVSWEELNFGDDVAGLSNSHTLDILQEVSNGAVTGNKAHRFIGWAQGVLCTEGVITLQEARDMNKKMIEEMYGGMQA